MKVKYSCNRWWPWLTAIIAIAVLFSMLPALVLASPGEEPPVETVYNVTFHSSGESMWMEGTAPDDFLNETIPIISESWYESGSTGYITEIAGSDFGGRIGGSTSGSINLAVDFYDFGSGSVDIDYPVQVKLVTPGANSFKPGDTVTINQV